MLQKTTAFDVVNCIFMVLLSLIFIYPLLMTLAQSFSDATEMVGKTVFLTPIGFNVESYKFILSDITIIRYYLNTILYAGLGTLFTLVFTALLAYPLTKKEFRGKSFISVLLLITMFFGGGMIPTYLVLKNYYHMLDTVWVMVLPGAVSAWNVIIFKNFFNSIPKELQEAAYIDGAGHFRVLFQIVMPLSKPLLATIALFTIVGHWNGYFNALLYLDTQDMFPIQMFLRKIMVTSEILSGGDLKNMELLTNQTDQHHLFAGLAKVAKTTEKTAKKRLTDEKTGDTMTSNPSPEGGKFHENRLSGY